MPVLSGRVLEKWTGLPVSGAVVNANGQTVIADRSGYFRVNISQQTADISVMHVGYTTEYTTVPMISGTNVEIDLIPNVRAL